MGTARYLSADVLGNISNSQVDRICLLVTEKCKLCLVCGHNNGDDRGTWLAALQGLLIQCISGGF
jgi:hypothetical protein